MDANNEVVQGQGQSGGGVGQGRGRGRGRGRGQGHGHAQGQGRGIVGERARGRGNGRGNMQDPEHEISTEEISFDEEEGFDNHGELQDAPVAQPINGAQIWQPPRPRYFVTQKEHRSEAVIKGLNPKELLIRHHKMTLDWDDRYKSYLLDAGLYGVEQISYILADGNLITSFVERWRDETHTFHLPVGEMAVTLQDVAMLLGLQIDGEPIYEPRRHTDWKPLIKRYLGVDADKDTFRKRSNTAIKISWLQKHFKTCPEGEEGREKVPYFARAYMLMLVGSVLFTDLTGDCVPVNYLPFIVNEQRRTYSWGSAVLAYLHKELCRVCLLKHKQIGGPVLLLQLWAWTRFLFGRPEARDGAQRPTLGGAVEANERPPYGYIWSGLHRWTDNPARSLSYYRDEIDLMREYQVNWTPYANSHHLLPPRCVELPHLWLINAPLICLQNVEPYNPHRVMRQFGKYQEIPPRCHINAILINCSKKSNENQALYVAHWNTRLNFQIIEDRPYDGTPIAYEFYMSWYAPNTILQLQPPKALGPSNIHPLQLSFQTKAPNNLQAIRELKKIADDAMSKRQETMEGGTKAFALNVLGGLKRVLKILGHNVEIDETFLQLQGQLQAEEQQEDAVLDNEASDNAGSSSHEEMSTDGSSTSDEEQSSGSKRLRGG